jgi:hypothetical protein
MVDKRFFTGKGGVKNDVTAGFRSDPACPLEQKCQLGTIIIGECQFNDSNEISGFIKVEINEEQLDSSDWH